jgi:glycosyltransferase involved in cell wall biosynthesis
MRIAHICQTYPPMISGQALMTSQLATGLSARGHKNMVFAASDSGQSYQKVEKDVLVDRTQSIQNPFRAGQHFFAWPYQKLAEKLSQFNPDLIHVHDPTSPAMLALKAKRELDIPALITVHQLPWFISSHVPNILTLDQQVEAQLWKYGSWILKQFDGTVAPTRTIADIIENEVGIPVEAISNGIDLDTYHNSPQDMKLGYAILEKYGILKDKPIILHVGQLTHEKRADVAVQASLRAMQKTDAQLLVVGDGPKLGDLKSLCKEAGLSKNCFFTGFIKSKAELSSLYNLSSVFVTASPIETQGLVVLEAAACGLPIVAVNATCIPELVKNGKNGILVPEHDEKSMADSLEIILKSRHLAKRMGNAGKGIAQGHDVESTIRKYESLYKLMVTQHAIVQPKNRRST